MRRSVFCMAAILALALPGAARADLCAVLIGNAAGGILVSVTVRAEFAPPGSAADRNLDVPLQHALSKDEVAAIRWDCPSNNISYVATGMFRNGIISRTEPFKPQPMFATGQLDTAWVR